MGPFVNPGLCWVHCPVCQSLLWAMGEEERQSQNQETGVGLLKEWSSLDGELGPLVALRQGSP